MDLDSPRPGLEEGFPLQPASAKNLFLVNFDDLCWGAQAWIRNGVSE